MNVSDMMDRKERPAYATFHRVAVEDKAKSREAGQYVAKDVDMVHVTPPYSKDVMKWKVTEWFENMRRDIAAGRMPQSWMDEYRKQYEAWQRGESLPPVGTPVKGWGVISPAQQETLIRMNILTVEDLAKVNDEGLRRIGMGALDLKNKAMGWLSQVHDKGPLTQEIAAVKSENRQLQSQVGALQKQVEALMTTVKLERGQTAPETEGISASDLIDDDRDTLAAQYKAKFGKAPHPATNIETLRQRLAE
jgi:hypothetical protein